MRGKGEKEEETRRERRKGKVRAGREREFLGSVSSGGSSWKQINS